MLLLKDLKNLKPKNLILRTYGLKGSEYESEVLTIKSETDFSKFTLKD